MEGEPLTRKRKLREEKKPACSECRRHKVRCDAFLDYSQPCSRCLRKRAKCIVLAETKRKHSPKDGQIPQSGSSLHDSAYQSEPSTQNLPLIPYIPSTQSSDLSPIRLRSASSSTPSPINVNSEGIAPRKPFPIDGTCTKSRTLANVHVEATMINICFALFDRHYAPLVPLLSHQPNPDETFHESILKFWVVVSIGSRKCLEDPTLFSTLSPHVEALAMTSLCPSRTSPYPVIEALLLMSTWHLSTDKPFPRSIYFTISSAIVTLTLQAGMHQCLSLQAVFPPKSNTAPDVARGAKLWAYAVILNQSAMAINGFPMNEILASRHLSRTSECCATMPSWLLLQGRIMAVITKAHHVVSDLESEANLNSQSKTLKSLIMAFEAELLNLDEGAKSEGTLSKLQFAIGRLQIWSLVFLAAPCPSDHLDLIQLSNAAIKTIHEMKELEKTYRISLYCPDHIFQGILLAACTLLKLIKSYPPMTFNETEQTSALFSAINMCKEISVVNNDIPAKISEILSKSWSSTKIYRDAHGDYIQSLQIGNRLTMSVVFDCLWWWRKLYIEPLNEQPIQNYTSTTPSGASHDEDFARDTSQLFFDDSWDWNIDWASIGSTGVMH